MSDQLPGDRPGHLDIDAVSAFIDQDLAPAELAILSIHLTECSACHREVLEIRATIMLLAGLPQYAPRRSFVLSAEHASAGRPRRHVRSDAPPSAWTPTLPASSAKPAAAVRGVAKYAAWLPGMQVAALVIGALLILVTAGDLTGYGRPEPAFLAAPTALGENPPTPAVAFLMPTATLAAPADTEQEQPIPRFAAAPSAAEGTTNTTGASEGMVADQQKVPAAPRQATVAVASVTQAVRTPVAGEQPASAEPVGQGQPSRLRLLQIALALAFVWLVVSIIGLRRVRA
jgi:anti-sigma factor RsiW